MSLISSSWLKIEDSTLVFDFKPFQDYNKIMSNPLLPQKISRKLTLKERRFIKFYLKTGNKSEAARLAGYKNVMSAWEVLDKPIIQQAIENIMDERGLSDGKLIDVMAEGVQANKVISANIYIKQDPTNAESPAVDMKPADGATMDFIEVPDWDARHKFVKLGLELRRRLDRIIDPSLGSLTINGNVNFVQAMIQRAKEY